MHLSRVEDEFMHRMDKEIDKDMVCAKRMGDNMVIPQIRNKVTTETRQELLTLALLVTEDEWDNKVPMYKEKSLTRR